MTAFQKVTVITAIGKLPLLCIPQASHYSHYFYFLQKHSRNTVGQDQRFRTTEAGK